MEQLSFTVNMLYTSFVVPFCAHTEKNPKTLKKTQQKEMPISLFFFFFLASHILFGHPDTFFDAAASMTRGNGQKQLSSSY